MRAITCVPVKVKIFRKHPRDQLTAYFIRSNFQRSSIHTLEDNFVADSPLKCTQRLSLHNAARLRKRDTARRRGREKSFSLLVGRVVISFQWK